MNHFELLGLPQSFAVDPKQLDAQFRAVSQKWHPDRFATEEPKARAAAAHMSVQVNDAYKTLRDPVARAAYLLKLHGLDLDDEGERTHQMNAAFLMEILERREALDDLKQKGDVDGAIAMGKDIAELEKQTHAQLAELFDAQSKAPEKARLQKLADLAAALRYYRRFQDEVEAIEEGTQP